MPVEPRRGDTNRVRVRSVAPTGLAWTPAHFPGAHALVITHIFWVFRVLSGLVTQGSDFLRHSSGVPAPPRSKKRFIRKERAHHSELATVCDQDAMEDAAAPRDFRRHHSGVRGGTKDGLRRASPTGGRMHLRRTLDLDIPCQVASQQSPTPFLQANRDYPMHARSASILRTPESCLQNPRGSRGLVPQKRQEMLLRRHAHAQTG